ncbi:ABC transporter permease [Pseudomonas sp. Pseusp3]|uniref:ABC transporter permease n=1 Tax=Pseudomonas sp. Pseusp3 TaxID=3243029 RepID=UPI0039AEF374
MKSNFKRRLTSVASQSWLYALVILAMLFLLIPTLIVIPMSFSDARYLSFPPKTLSFQAYLNYVASVEWRSSTTVSLITATITTLLATILGTAASYALHNSTQRYVRILRGLMMAPMIVPTIFTALGLFFVFAHFGLNNSIPGLVIGHTLLALPYVIINVSAGLKTYDMTQEHAACILGASRIRAFVDITLPQIRFSVIAAALFSFAVSLDEAVVSLFISGGDGATLTKRMFTSLRSDIDPVIAVVATIMTLLSCVMLAITLMSQRRARRYENVTEA